MAAKPRHGLTKPALEGWADVEAALADPAPLAAMIVLLPVPQLMGRELALPSCELCSHVCRLSRRKPVGFPW